MNPYSSDKTHKKPSLKTPKIRSAGQFLYKKTFNIQSKQFSAYVALALLACLWAAFEWYKYFRNIPPNPVLISIGATAITLFCLMTVQKNKERPELLETKVILTCPFCFRQCITAKPGVTRCPVCDAAFDIDEQGEFIFGDIENLRLPALGTICASCGLIQAGDHHKCLYCGTVINITIQ